MSLIYSAIASLDGYVADEAGNFDWAEPGDEAHAFINDLERSVGLHLYGRRMYEVMVAWETLTLNDGPPVMRDFAEIWRGADKIVYSKTLQTVSSAKTRLERDFDPEEVRRMKAREEGDISIAGPSLAAYALRSGLIDECRLFIAPTVVGGGIKVFPGNIRLRLELLDERRFDDGMAYVRYRTAG